MKFDKDKFKKAIERMLLAFSILMVIAILENIIYWIIRFIANLIK